MDSYNECFSLWIGDRLSMNEILTIKSWLANGYNFSLYSYGELENLPEGVTLLDANDIIPVKDIYRSFGSFAHFADEFRWRVLSYKDMMWVDMDMVCLKPVPHDKYIFGWQDNSSINISILKFSEPSIPHLMVDRCEKYRYINGFKEPYKQGRGFLRSFQDCLLCRGSKSIKEKFKVVNSWGGVSGPLPFTDVVINSGLKDCSKPYFYYYPISDPNWGSIYNSTFSDIDIDDFFKESYTIHLWNKLSSDEAGYSEDSLFGKLALKYC